MDKEIQQQIVFPAEVAAQNFFCRHLSDGARVMES